MYSGVGGSTVLYAGDWPRLTPSDFRVRSLDGVADDWPLTLRGARAVLRPHRAPGRRRGLRGRPGLPGGRRPAAAAAAARPRRHGRGARARPARLALVAGAERDPLGARTRAGTPCAQLGRVHAGLPRGREGARPTSPTGRRRSRAAPACSRGARVDAAAARRGRPRDGRRVRGRGGPRRRARRPTSWCSPRTRSAPRGCCCCPPASAFPDGLANTSGLVGRRLMMHPFAVATGVFAGAARDLARQRRLAHPLAAVLRERRAPRLRARREVEPRALDRRADERRDAGARRRGRLGCPSTTSACASASATA